MVRLVSIIVVFFLFLTSCSRNRTIADGTDFIEYLSPHAIQSKIYELKNEISFWENKLESDTGSFVYMQELARLHLQVFQFTGEIGFLVKGDSLLHLSSAKLNHSDPEMLYALAQNNIMQHRFQRAALYIDSAEKRQGDMYIIRLLQFDVYMELGRYADAYKCLKSLKDNASFDYLIRKSRWEDHKGNLNGSILLMEEALMKIKSKNTHLYVWALSNLGDLYGHAGRIKDAYAAYLEVLNLNPSDFYCLKGIAWIAYAHDKNIELAKQTLMYIQAQSNFPDINLMLAEIAEAENRPDEAGKLLSLFLNEVTGPVYGNMYNKYLIDIWSADSSNTQNALALALQELENRFTPETCDWVAWAYYQNGNLSEALKWTSSYVIGQTSEPEALMHSAFILAANGKKSEAKSLANESLAGSFELGPQAERKIKELLTSL